MQRRVGRSVQNHSGLEHCGRVLRCAAQCCDVLQWVAVLCSARDRWPPSTAVLHIGCSRRLQSGNKPS